MGSEAEKEAAPAEDPLVLNIERGAMHIERVHSLHVTSPGRAEQSKSRATEHLSTVYPTRHNIGETRVHS